MHNKQHQNTKQTNNSHMHMYILHVYVWVGVCVWVLLCSVVVAAAVDFENFISTKLKTNKICQLPRSASLLCRRLSVHLYVCLFVSLLSASLPVAALSY